MEQNLSQKKSHLTVLFNIGLADGGVDGAERAIIDQVAARLGLSEQVIKECLECAQSKSELDFTKDLNEQVLLILDAVAVAMVTDGIDSNEIKVLTKLCIHLGLASILDEIDKLPMKDKTSLIINGEYRESLAAKFTEDLEKGLIKRSNTSRTKNKTATFSLN